MNQKAPIIYVLATPLGNLEDISERALRTLKETDIIAAEDTRRVRKILSHYSITGKNIISYHDHVEREKAVSICNKLLEHGHSLTLVSDAGTPCIADPGYRLISVAHELKIKVSPIPGPSAVTSLVSASGLPSDRFLFVGFLPTHKKELEQEILSWKRYGSSILFFDPARKLAKTLKIIAEYYPGSMVTIGRELTKIFEEIVKMPIEEAILWADTHETLKGEVSVMLAPQVVTKKGEIQKNHDEPECLIGPALEKHIIKEAKKYFSSGETLRDVLKKFNGLQISRKELYNLLLRAKE